MLIRTGVIGPGAERLSRYNTEQRGNELHAVKDDEGAYVSHWVTCTNRPNRR